jgi:hypothetical protein
MTQLIPQCLSCYWFSKDGSLRCNAYPDINIPIPIWMNEFDHIKPFKGDHGYRYIKKS